MSKIRAWRFLSVVMALMLVLQVGVIAVLPTATIAADPVVTFPDANLEAAIRVAISKPTGDIRASELAVLTTLDASNKGIANLSGLEYCTNLTDLVLSNNQISNLTPLAGLTNLTFLLLNDNQIINLTPLAGLTSLTTLFLYSNQIINLTPLAGLTELGCLLLDNNQIIDLTPLAGLISLDILWLSNNQISDLTPLAVHPTLTQLVLHKNQISDIAPLLSNIGLGTGDTVDLRSNPLSPTSVNVYIPTLQARGVTVLWSPAVTTGTGVYVSPTWFYLTGNLDGLGTADTSVTPSIDYWGPAGGTWTLATMTSKGPFSTPTTLQTPPGAMPAGTYTFRAKVQGDQSGTWAYGDNATFIFQPSQPPTPIPTPTPTLPNPLIGMGAPTSHGSSVSGTTTTTQPVSLPNIQIQSAAISAAKVAPGTPVTVTANVANRGTVNASTKIKLYINGEEDSSQGVTVESGGNRPVYFTVSRSQPGTYNVYIGGTQAGRFTVEDAIDPNIILYISLSMIVLALVVGAIMIVRRKSYY